MKLKIPKLWWVDFSCGHHALVELSVVPRKSKFSLECPGCQKEVPVLTVREHEDILFGPFHLAKMAAGFKKERDNLRQWMKWILKQKPGDVGAGRLPVWIEKTLRSALDGNAPLPLCSRRKVR